MSLLKRPKPLSTNQLLRQIIEDPALATAIQSLAPEPLARLIDHVGLEDAGEILSLTTTDQLLGVFDSDLWKRERGGEEETFVAKRFLLWLETLLEAGEKKLVSRLVDLPEELVYLAFYTHILVLNRDDLGVEELSWSSEKVDLTDKALMDCLGHELDEYIIIARQHDGWDALLTTIVALDEHEPDFLNRILSRCCYASSEYIEENGGLYAVLSAEEMLEVDAAADRADRRAGRGYVAPSDAAALLKLAVNADLDDLLTASEPDPITRAYFRELSPSGTPTAAANARSPFGLSARRPGQTSSRLIPLLKKAGILEEPLLSLAVSEDASRRKGRFQTAITALLESDPDGHERRVQLLIYLANIVDAGLGSSEEPIRPVDALKAVLGVCDAGLGCLDDHAPRQGAPISSDSPLRDLSPVTLFLSGWRVLSEHGTLDSMAALERAIRDAGPVKKIGRPQATK